MKYFAIKLKGFTLIEVVVVTALIGFLSLIIAVVISNGYKSYANGQKLIDLNEKCSKAILDFERYARGTTLVVSANPNEFTFMTYLKGDQNPAPSKISYYIVNGKLYRSTITPIRQGIGFIYPQENNSIESVASNVQGNNIFIYFNEVNGELDQPLQIDLIKMVKITLTLDDDTVMPPEGATHSTAIQFRNLKTNL